MLADLKSCITFAEVMVHGSNFIAWSSFRKLASGISWMVLNGIKVGQKSQVSLYFKKKHVRVRASACAHAHTDTHTLTPTQS